MKKFSFLFIIGAAGAGVGANAGASADTDTATATTLQCTDGFTNEVRTISEHQINDGYCDCPLDGGKDEFETEACSGSIHWAGVGHGNHGDEEDGDDDDDDNMKDLVTYTCPQQPKLQLPLSRLNDGICDCCDGSDENIPNPIPTKGKDTTCKDVCDEVLAEERKRTQQLSETYQAGSLKRQEAIETYQQLYRAAMEEYEMIQTTKIPPKKQMIQELQHRINIMKKDLLQKHFDTVDDILENTIDNNGKILRVQLPGTMGQWKEMIAATCQIYGEMTKSANISAKSGSGSKDGNNGKDEEEDVCVPLIQAGIDLGILFNTSKGSDSVDKIKVQSGAREIDGDGNGNGNGTEASNLRGILADLLLAKSKIQVEQTGSDTDTDDDDEDDVEEEQDTEEEDEWEDPEDAFIDMDDDYYGGKRNPYDEDDDDAYDDDYHQRDTYNNHNHNNANSQKKGKDQNTANHIPVQVSNALEFSTRYGEIMRRPFDVQARKVMANMNAIMQQFNEGDDNEDDDEDDDNHDEDDFEEGDEGEEDHDDSTTSTPPPQVDPMALQMNLNTLSRRLQQIEYGNKLGHSASMMLQALEQHSMSKSEGKDMEVEVESFRKDLERLVLLTAYHTNISAADLAEIVTVILADVDITVNDDTCYSPYIALCNNVPMKDAAKDDAVILFPPPSFKESIEERCSMRNKIDNGTCGTASADDDIPSRIPNGYFNYYESKPRTTSKKKKTMNDPLSIMFESYDSDIFGHSSLGHLKDEVSHHTQEIKKLKERKTKIMESFGGIVSGDSSNDGGGKNKNKNKTNKGRNYGSDGELYNLRDECYEITANKYTYEVCMFGKAWQRDVGKKNGGTDLGKWDGMSIDDNTGDRTMRWKDGTKCWNGPKRSATVFVTCGIETKLISADEPNICEYEFHMESHIGCDESFRLAHNL